MKIQMMRMLVLIICSFGFSAYSQKWENITNKEFVYSIVGEGEYLWIGTNGGLVKFNKRTEETVVFDRANTGIPDNNVMTVCPDRDKNLWVGSQYSGIGVFKDQACLVYNSKNSNLPFDQFNSCIAIDSKNDKYIGSSGSVSLFNHEAFDRIKEMDILSSFDNIRDIKFDDKQQVWIASYTGLYKYNGATIGKELNGDISSIEFDKDKKMWVGTSNGLFCFDGIKWETFNSGNSGLVSNIIRKLNFDSMGNLWLCAYDNLICYTPSGEWITHPCETQSFGEFRMYTMYIDTENKIWIGSRENGLMIFENNTFRKINYSQPSLLSTNAINSLVSNNGKIWFSSGTKNGLQNFDGKQFNFVDISVPNSTGSQMRLISPANNGDLIMCKQIFHESKEGIVYEYKLIRYDGSKFNEIETPIFLDACYVIKEDKKGVFWFGTGNGVYRWDGVTWLNYNVNNSPLTSNIILDIDFDQLGNIWIGQHGMIDENGDVIGGGLARFDGDKDWKVYDIKNSEIPYNNVMTLKVDKNNTVWLGTVNDEVYDGGGLTTFDGVNWRSYNMENSEISDNQVLDIVDDAAGNLWCGTKFGGLVEFDKVSKWNIYTQSNSGIALNYVQELLVDDNGKIWMSHNQTTGISIFDRLVTGIVDQEIDSMSNVRLYPNPSSDFVTIESKLPDDFLVEIKVYDVYGILLFRKTGLGNSNTYRLEKKQITNLKCITCFIEVVTKKSRTTLKSVLKE